MGILSKWKSSASNWKLLIIPIILVLLILIGTRRFLHNLTTPIGWWMFLIGMLVSAAILLILSNEYYPFIIEDLTKIWQDSLSGIIESFKGWFN